MKFHTSWRRQPLHVNEKRSLVRWDASLVPAGRGPLLAVRPCGYLSWVDGEIVRPGVVRATGKRIKVIVNPGPLVGLTLRIYRVGWFTIGWAR